MTTSPTSPSIRRRRKRFDGRLSRVLDRAQVQLEAADDPAVVAIYRQLIESLERAAMEANR